MGRKTLSGSTIEKVRAAKPQAARLFEKSGALVGVGITRHGSGYGLKVNLSRPLSQSDALPAEINGVPVQIAVVGTIRKQ
jgi:hypothetical protein